MLLCFQVNSKGIQTYIFYYEVYFIWSVQFSCFSCVQLFATPSAAHQASLSITNTWSLLKLTSIKSVMTSNHFFLCHCLLLLPSIFPSFGIFSSESVLHNWWPKYCSFSFSISPSNEYSGLISFRIDWLDLLAVQGTLKSLLQHHSSKASIIWCSAFFIVQLSHPYKTTGALLLFQWSSRCWQFDICFLWLFQIQLEHLEVHSSHTVEAWLGEFWALLC